MSVEFDFSFPRRFACELLQELPGGPAPLHYFPRGLAVGQDGVMVQVQPDAAERWIGMFAFGKFGNAGVTRVLSMPDPRLLCVVARGGGYLVTAASPNAWEPVNEIPIVDIRAVPGAGLVVFAGQTDLIAYGERGVSWRTKRVAWDGLRILAVDDRAIIGEYWDLREDAMQQFEVDLATGKVRGGVEA